MAEPSNHRRGLMLVLSSPSGAGKTTLSRMLLESDRDVVMSVSATTRAPRPSEREGVDYFFLSEAEFDERVEQEEFLEHATVFQYRYGTPRSFVEDNLRNGRDVLFDIDWQGTQELAQIQRQDLVCIFILPPSVAELERRLKNRAQDSDSVVKSRMARAAVEISHWAEYDYVLVNDDLETTLAKIRTILAAERLRRDRQPRLHDFAKQLERDADSYASD